MCEVELDYQGLVTAIGISLNTIFIILLATDGANHFTILQFMGRCFHWLKIRQ
jgi:hypothetical protein